MRTPVSPRTITAPQAWQQATTRLMWAACALVLVGVVLCVGLLSPARGAWGVGSVYADVSADRKSLTGSGADSIARANAVHKRALAAQQQEMAAFNASQHQRDFMLLDMWDTLGPTFPCVERERFGERFEGGKWVCSPYEILSQEPCFVYSLGCNGISGFEEDIKARYPHCTIHIYDPTVSEKTAAVVSERTQGTLHRKWITSEDNVDAPHEYPDTPRGRTWSHEWTTLAREMQEHGAKWINILKVDIEGSEFDLFEDFFKTGRHMPFSEILIELHVPKLMVTAGQTWGPDTPARMKYFFDQLTANGFRIANTEPNLRCGRKLNGNCMNYIEYSLVKTDDGGNLVFAEQ